MAKVEIALDRVKKVMAKHGLLTNTMDMWAHISAAIDRKLGKPDVLPWLEPTAWEQGLQKDLDKLPLTSLRLAERAIRTELRRQSRMANPQLYKRIETQVARLGNKSLQRKKRQPKRR